MQGYVGGNLPPPSPIEQVPSPPVENPPPVHVAAAENVGEAGMDPELAAPPAPEIDLFAYENLGGFDMKVEENWGGVQMAPNMFAWANANADMDLILKDMVLPMKTLKLLVILRMKKNLQKLWEVLVVRTACLLCPP